MICWEDGGAILTGVPQRFKAASSWGCRGEQRSLQLCPGEREDKNLSLPGPLAIYNYPNPALHIPYNLPDMGL